MDISTAQPTQYDGRRTSRSFFLGIAIWFLDQNIIYALPSLACKWNWFPFSIAGLSGLQVVELIFTLITLALMSILIYLPWRNWRSFQSERPPENPEMLQDTEKDRRPLDAFIVMGLNSFFLLFTIASFVPIFALNACTHG
jgi:threonine/homoserine/homoserine lactone efflux protein